MPDSAAIASAAALGVAGGTRTFVPPAALIINGRGPEGVGRFLLLAAALGEMGADKVPGIPGRVEPPGMVGRLVVSGVSGHALAGRRGAAMAATAAAVSALGTWRARSEIGKATGIPDPALAVAEDVLALTVAGLAVRSAPHDGGEAGGQSGASPQADAEDAADTGVAAAVRDAARGLAAAAVGTAAMTGAQLLYYRLTGAQESRAPEAVVRKLLREAAGMKVPRKHRQKLNWAAHAGYGLSWGIPFGLVAGRRAKAVPAGLGFGGAVWAASLVELPALGQAPPVWDMPVEHVALDAGFHLVYGLAAGATLAALP